MPIDCLFLPALGLCYGRFRGNLTYGEIAGAHARHAAAGICAPGMRLLVDLRGVDSIELDMQAMRALIAQMKAQAETRFKLIVLLAERDAAYGHARQFQTLASLDGGLRVLLERGEAEALHVLGRAETGIAALLSTHAPG